jgi:hypothetical protein
MQQLLYTLPALCPIGMGAMMWFMMRGSNKNKDTDPGTTTAQEQELAALRAEIDHLRTAQQSGTTAPDDAGIFLGRPTGATR